MSGSVIYGNSVFLPRTIIHEFGARGSACYDQRWCSENDVNVDFEMRVDCMTRSDAVILADLC